MNQATTQDQLWQEHRERLVRFVRTRVADAATAEDIAHDVLMRAWIARDTLRDGRRFQQWLYQITRNAVIDYYRARRPTVPLTDAFPEPDSDEGRVARGQLAHCIQPFVAALPDHYRAALELAELRGLTQQQTADELGLSLSGAKSRVQRARRMLADMVLECCRIEFDSAGGIMEYEARARGTAAGGCGPCAPDAIVQIGSTQTR